MIVLCSMLVFCMGLYPMSSLGLRGSLHQILKDFVSPLMNLLKFKG